MDFGLLPPEINSGRIYSGPGAMPMLAAAAWSNLAEELDLAAAGYGSVITGLTADGWRGPSSAAMAHAAAGYLAWLHRTAAQAEQTAAQATAAAGAYQTVFSASVPPPLIAANRSRLLALVSTNLFGQNSPAIAATEAQYELMWAQDVGAMQGYALAASTTSRLTPFTPPAPTTQAAAAPVNTLAAAAPAQAVSTPGLLTYLLQIPSLTSAAASVSSSSFSGASIQTTNHALAVNAQRDQAQGIGPFWVGATHPTATATPPARPPVSGLMGEASAAGRLSVPPSWATTVRPVAASVAPLSMTPAAAPPVAAPIPASGVVGEALVGTLAGRGVSNAAGKVRRPGAGPRRPAAGERA